MGRKHKQTFLQRRHTDGQEAHEKMFNIVNYYRNANQNYNEVSPHTSQNGSHQKNLQAVRAREGVERKERSSTVGGNDNLHSHYGEQYVYMCTKSLLCCLTLCNHKDCNLPGSSAHGIIKARGLEGVAMPFSRGSS